MDSNLFKSFQAQAAGLDDKAKISLFISFIKTQYNAIDSITKLLTAGIAPNYISFTNGLLTSYQIMTADRFNANVLSKFKYQKTKLDSVDVVVWPPYLTNIIKIGICGDAAFYCAACRKNPTIWFFLSSVQFSTSAGHCIMIDGDWNVWSNFKLDGSAAEKQIGDIASKYVSDWKYAVQIGTDFTINQIITRK